jgi:sugar phosphate isomerase/epimerase
MIAYGFRRGHLATDLDLARRLGAACIEALPDWRQYPDPIVLKAHVEAAGLAVHSAHGCWGGQAIAADRVDLGGTEPGPWRESIDDIRRCIDWLAAAGGTCLVVHPGGLSDPEDADARRDALARALLELADHAAGGPVVLCVENLPPGVHPGSRMRDLAGLVAELNRPEIALALDTGHAHMGVGLEPETLAAGAFLRTTHVHDNNGRQDTHAPPGSGTIAWAEWPPALDAIGYEGPIMLECIKALRDDPRRIDAALLRLLGELTGMHHPADESDDGRG